VCCDALQGFKRRTTRTPHPALNRLIELINFLPAARGFAAVAIRSHEKHFHFMYAVTCLRSGTAPLLPMTEGPIGHARDGAKPAR